MLSRDNVKAAFDKGVLKIVLPKTEEAGKREKPSGDK